MVMDEQIRYTKDDEWRGTTMKSVTTMKRRKVEIIIRKVLKENGITDKADVKRIFEIVSSQKEY